MKAFLALALLLLIISSCNENGENDPCDNITCYNGGTCEAGVCHCASGWTGTFCDSLVNPCDTVNCPGINSTCIDGVCYCHAGYEGTYCDILTYEKYIGAYHVSESCTASFGNVIDSIYTTTITPGSTIDVIIINNFSNRGLPVETVILDATLLVIPIQNIGAIEVSGIGQYRDNYQIFFEYSYTIAGNLHSCTAIFTKF